MAKIILFGGSFDPIHLGHLAMARAALHAIEAQQVIFIPAKKPRWKKLTGRDEDRLRLLRLALQDEKAFSYSTYELEAVQGGHYTVDTVRYFLQKNKENGEKNEYYYLIGGDQLEKLHLWHEIDQLSSLIHILAYQREDQATAPKQTIENIDAYHVTMIHGDSYAVSSTAIRNLQSIDVPQLVLEDMMEHHLYRFQTIFNYLDEKRYRHSCSVALLAKTIAEKNGINPYLAFLAGILHDIGKNSERIEEGMKIMEQQWSEMLFLPSWAYHQFISATYARTIFKVKDKDVLDAIAYHCTGKPKMSPLAMIIYASDKIDPLRDYDSSWMIKACLEDYYKGFLIVLKENKAFLESKGNFEHNPFTLGCFQYYLEKREKND